MPERLQHRFDELHGPADITSVLPGEENYWRHYSSDPIKKSDTKSIVVSPATRSLVVSSPNTIPRLCVAHGEYMKYPDTDLALTCVIRP